MWFHEPAREARRRVARADTVRAQRRDRPHDGGRARHRHLPAVLRPPRRARLHAGADHDVARWRASPRYPARGPLTLRADQLAGSLRSTTPTPPSSHRAVRLVGALDFITSPESRFASSDARRPPARRTWDGSTAGSLLATSTSARAVAQPRGRILRAGPRCGGRAPLRSWPSDRVRCAHRVAASARPWSGSRPLAPGRADSVRDASPSSAASHRVVGGSLARLRSHCSPPVLATSFAR